MPLNKNYTGTTRFIDDESMLTAEFGYTGDIAIILSSGEEDSTEPPTAVGMYVKFGKNWIQISGSSAGADDSGSQTTPPSTTKPGTGSIPELTDEREPDGEI